MINSITLKVNPGTTITKVKSFHHAVKGGHWPPFLLPEASKRQTIHDDEFTARQRIPDIYNNARRLQQNDLSMASEPSVILAGCAVNAYHCASEHSKRIKCQCQCHCASQRPKAQPKATALSVHKDRTRPVA